MGGLIPLIGFVFVFVLIWRYATKKVKNKRQPGTGGVLFVPGRGGSGGSAAMNAGPGLGTLIAVNVIGAIGVGGSLFAFTLDEPLMRVLVGLGAPMLCVFITMKVVQAVAIAPYPLKGHLIEITCGMVAFLWFFIPTWVIEDIAAFFGVL